MHSGVFSSAHREIPPPAPSWEITRWCSDSRVTARDQRKYQSQLDEDLKQEQGSLRIKGEGENSSFKFLHQFKFLSFEMPS